MLLRAVTYPPVRDRVFRFAPKHSLQLTARTVTVSKQQITHTFLLHATAHVRLPESLATGLPGNQQLQSMIRQCR